MPRPIAVTPDTIISVTKKKRQQHKVKNQLKEHRPAVVFETAPAPRVDALHHKEEHVPSHFSYAGNSSLPITSKLKIVGPEEDVPGGIWPVFRMMVRVHFCFDSLLINCHEMDTLYQLNDTFTRTRTLLTHTLYVCFVTG